MTFLYKCKKCEHEFEYRSYRSDDYPECPECHSARLEKLFAPKCSHILKGDGWAKDNYGLKPSRKK